MEARLLLFEKKLRNEEGISHTHSFCSVGDEVQALVHVLGKHCTPSAQVYIFFR
jgi:hypothetical protein